MSELPDYEDPPPPYTKTPNAYLPVGHDETLVPPPGHSDAERLKILENATRNLKFSVTRKPDANRSIRVRPENATGNRRSPLTGKTGSKRSEKAQNTATKFPRTTGMKGYFKWDNISTSTFHIGATKKNSKLFAVSTFSNSYTDNPSVTLHDGASHDHPILATFTANNRRRYKPGIFHIPVRPGSLYTREIMTTMEPYWQEKFRAWGPVWSFSAPLTTEGTREERFEWRCSSGKEVEEISTGYVDGWKLARVSGPNKGRGGPRKQRDFGFTSDGLEIVAVVAHNPSSCMAKALRFAFMGTGLTGELGEIWEIMAVVSALQLWYWRAQEAAEEKARAAASDSSTNLLLMTSLYDW
ncbi:hypothetical protein N7493_011728 [Penicillium malachiteum]|uniref:Uncharacterized protein n=1 Tax=Penicillium malachiteum TaxID=1324776 RepID=A0AAD6MQ27_9EURO|nr:hypothetical protein N7493_011728 [Penicillium malachiteum]